MFSSLLEDKSRRDMLKLAAAGVFAPTLSGWLPLLAKAAPTGGTGKVKSCILLWMDGGPSHKDTWDLKPTSKGAGEFKPIKTAASGVEISEHLPNVAKVMNHGVVVRGMSTPEGAHARAKYYMHTGFREGQGGVTYPALGSIVSKEKGKTDSTVPNYVAIGGRSYGSGFLGPKHQPLLITDPNRGLQDLKTSVSSTQFDNRTGLLGEMEKAFHREYGADAITDHKTTYERAVKLMQSKEAKAFDIGGDPSKSKYGTGRFGEGVLMARRLVEVGVPFVEVALGGWDTHQDNFTRVKSLSGQVDAALSALVNDLKAKGLLDSTLIVWMGEFGRTPNINTRGAKPGRDHFPRAWSLAMFGGGINTGKVIGQTDKEGASVVDRKTTAQDFLATVCEMMGIDHTKKNETPSGRPIQIVDKPKPFTKEHRVIDRWLANPTRKGRGCAIGGRGCDPNLRHPPALRPGFATTDRLTPAVRQTRNGTPNGVPFPISLQLFAHGPPGVPGGVVTLGSGGSVGGSAGIVGGVLTGGTAGGDQTGSFLRGGGIVTFPFGRK